MRTVSWPLRRFFRDYWRSGLLCLLLALLLLYSWHQGVALRIRGEPISERFSFYGIPVALSRMDFGHKKDYAGYNLVARTFTDESPPRDSLGIDELIDRARRLPPDQVRASGDWLIPADDKGLVDFVWLAFLLFGTCYESLHAFFFVLLSLGVLTFVLAFFDQVPRLIFLALFLASFYVVLFVIPLSDQFGGVVQPRYFEILSVVPLLHLVFLILDRRPFSWFGLLLVLVQVALVVFVLHARASAVWQVGCLVVLLGGFVLAKLFSRGEVGGWGRRALTAGREVLIRGWPLAVLLAGLLALQEYKQLSYHPEYFTAHGSRHVFWHNVLMGLSAHPDLAARYDLAFVDEKVALLVDRYLQAHGEKEKRQVLFGNPNYNAGNWKDFDWVLYEPIARTVCLDVFAHAPGRFLETLLIYKPLVFCQNVAWIAGVGSQQQVTRYLGGTVAAEDVRRSRGLYYNPFCWTVLGVIGCTLLVSLPRHQGNLKPHVLATLLVFGFSLTPSMAVLPILPYIGVPLVLLTTLTCLLLLGTVSHLGKRLVRLFLPAQGFFRHPQDELPMHKAA
jgi:hypothetical protein